ncbi:10081_t:CDS:2 [Entrophospora sp. SA101]|nr:9273_t:CDS:2 [Entrophospora sp. SA101]CAJ0635613.1 10081_t:CDS:2 [Entrophospora sp. SA101]
MIFKGSSRAINRKKEKVEDERNFEWTAAFVVLRPNKNHCAKEDLSTNNQLTSLEIEDTAITNLDLSISSLKKSKNN